MGPSDWHHYYNWVAVGASQGITAGTHKEVIGFLYNWKHLVRVRFGVTVGDHCQWL